MGFFERLGRKAEEVKQQVEGARAEEATHRCADCGELSYAERAVCPECGSEEIEEMEKTEKTEKTGETEEAADSQENEGDEER